MAAFIAFSGCTSRRQTSPTWAEEFDAAEFDTTIWSKIPRGGGGWWVHMSSYDGCYEMRDGCLILKGIVNPGVPGDDADLLTGGLWTIGKKYFGYGRLEIRAKIGEAGGAWPALWMMPKTWNITTDDPYWAEIDICEKLNFDDFAYQTLHSNYTQSHPDEQHSATGNILRNEFNVYAVEHYRDSIKLYINDICTFCYKKRPELGLEQWNFDQEYALFVDMQVGSPWPGEAVLEDLPIEMAIDWIRFYEFSDEYKKK